LLFRLKIFQPFVVFVGYEMPLNRIPMPFVREKYTRKSFKHQATVEFNGMLTPPKAASIFIGISNPTKRISRGKLNLLQITIYRHSSCAYTDSY
jgi:hypothetical protein